jgi:hypothetical protein
MKPNKHLTTSNTIKDSVKRNLAQIRSLDFGRNSDQLTTQSILTCGIQHLALNFRGIRSPSKVNPKKLTRRKNKSYYELLLPEYHIQSQTRHNGNHLLVNQQ